MSAPYVSPITELQPSPKVTLTTLTTLTTTTNPPSQAYATPTLSEPRTAETSPPKQWDHYAPLPRDHYLPLVPPAPRSRWVWIPDHDYYPPPSHRANIYCGASAH